MRSVQRYYPNDTRTTLNGTRTQIKEAIRHSRMSPKQSRKKSRVNIVWKVSF